MQAAEVDLKAKTTMEMVLSPSPDDGGGLAGDRPPKAYYPDHSSWPGNSSYCATGPCLTAAMQPGLAQQRQQQQPPHNRGK